MGMEIIAWWMEGGCVCLTRCWVACLAHDGGVALLLGYMVHWLFHLVLTVTELACLRCVGMQAVMLTRSYMDGNAQITVGFWTAIKFPVPAFIYFICNNVNFIILSEISPASYQVLNNLKV